MECRESFMKEEGAYFVDSSPEIAENGGLMSSSVATTAAVYQGIKTRRSKRDSMSSVDSNYSDKFLDEKGIDEELSQVEVVKKTGKKRGRKPTQLNLEAKLERSRQSARECRARKKLRYQGLENAIAEKEAKIYALRKEVQKCVHWAEAMNEGRQPQDLNFLLQTPQMK